MFYLLNQQTSEKVWFKWKREREKERFNGKCTRHIFCVFIWKIKNRRLNSINQLSNMEFIGLSLLVCA